MKRLIIIISIFFILLLSLCSFVNPDTYDVFEGSLQFVSSTQSVVHLSGACKFYLLSYEHLAFTEGTNHLMSLVSNTGIVRVGSTDYNCRFSANGEFEIEQEYYQNNFRRTTWVQYHLSCDSVPQTVTTSTFLPFICVFLALLVVLLILSFFVR